MAQNEQKNILWFTCKGETLWSVLWLTTPLLRFRFPFDMEYGIAVVLGCGSKGDPQR
jgi:hypothetical protein